MDGWGEMVWEMNSSNPIMALGVLGFMVIASLGVMNIIVGIMCESAIDVTTNLREKGQRTWFLAAKDSINEIRRHLAFYATAGNGTITRGQLKKGLHDLKIERN